MIHVTIENFPYWAIYHCYSQGDIDESLSSEDLALIDEFRTEHHLGEIISSPDKYEEGYNEFDPFPAFGEACNTATVVFERKPLEPGVYRAPRNLSTDRLSAGLSKVSKGAYVRVYGHYATDEVGIEMLDDYSTDACRKGHGHLCRLLPGEFLGLEYDKERTETYKKYA